MEINDKPTKVGVIHEIGDLGIGFTEISEEDLKRLKKDEKNKKK